MSFLIGLFSEFIVILVIAAAFGLWEYIAYRMSARAWMWVAGLAGIGVLIWFKGADEVTSWMLGAGWVGVLAYFDHKLHVEKKVAEAARDIAPAGPEPPKMPRY